MSAFYEAALPAAAMSDPSALSQIGGWFIFAAAVAAIAIGRHRWVQRNHHTPRPASCPSTGAGRGHDTPCARMDCDQPATNHVIASGEWWAFCKPHALPYLTAPYDQERDITDRDFREVRDDARRITREASGGVA